MIGADVYVPEETLQGLLEETSAVLDGHPSLTYGLGVGLKPIQETATRSWASSRRSTAITSPSPAVARRSA